MLYRTSHYTAAWLTSSLATVPATVCFFAIADLLTRSDARRPHELLAGIMINVYTLPTALVASLLASLPFVVLANRTNTPLKAGFCMAVGVIAGGVFALGWCAILKPTSGASALLALGLFDGAVGGFSMERTLKYLAGPA
jgi:hypothetical protein